MKKILQMLVVVCIIVLGTQAAFANAEQELLPEGADISGINRLAIGAPLYMQVNALAPDREALTRIIYEASRVTRTDVISYDTVVDGIKQARHIDIKALPRREGAKIFKENVSDYADAYVVLTVANNSRTEFFFDVYKSGTDELLYTFRIQANKSEPDSAETFNKLSEQFYKRFDRAAEGQLKIFERNQRNKDKE